MRWLRWYAAYEGRDDVLREDWMQDLIRQSFGMDAPAVHTELILENDHRGQLKIFRTDEVLLSVTLEDLRAEGRRLDLADHVYTWDAGHIYPVDGDVAMTSQHTLHPALNEQESQAVTYMFCRVLLNGIDCILIADEEMQRLPLVFQSVWKKDLVTTELHFHDKRYWRGANCAAIGPW